MRQFNMNATAEFERDLRRLMKNRKLTRKADAVRLAVHEAAAKPVQAERYDFSRLLGLGVGPGEVKNPRFKTTDDIWS